MVIAVLIMDNITKLGKMFQFLQNACGYNASKGRRIFFQKSFSLNIFRLGKMSTKKENIASLEIKSAHHGCDCCLVTSELMIQDGKK